MREYLEAEAPSRGSRAAEILVRSTAPVLLRPHVPRLEADLYQRLTQELRVARVRLGLRVAGLFVVAFAALDPIFAPDFLLELYALKVGQLTGVAGGYWLLRSEWGQRRSGFTAVIAIAVLASFLTAGSVLIGDTLISVILFTGVAVVGGAMIPWSARTQLAFCLILAIAVVLNVVLVHGAVSGALGYPQLGALGFFAVSVHLAHVAERHRVHLFEVEQDLEQARKRAARATDAKARFLAIMTHELRTPMNAVLGSVELLRTTHLDEEQVELVEAMTEGGEVLLELIEHVLDFSKTEAGQLQLAEAELDLAELLGRTLRLFETKAAQKGLALSGEVAPEAPQRVVTDPARVHQVLLNLVGNAVKFTDEGSVRVELDAKPRQGGGYTLTGRVSDTGPGIARSAQGGLFEAFTRGDSPLTRRVGGTGLGLAISQRICRQLGGRITVESAPGAGAVFEFEVEVQAVSAAVVGSDLQEPPPSTYPLRVLLAEDNHLNRMVAEKMLVHLGHSVVCVDDGGPAVELASTGEFDLVLMDLFMGEMDGIEALRQLRRTPGGAHVPVVALTANTSGDDEAACMAAGMCGFVTKPVTIEALATTIRDAIARAPSDSR